MYKIGLYECARQSLLMVIFNNPICYNSQNLYIQALSTHTCICISKFTSFLVCVCILSLCYLYYFQQMGCQILHVVLHYFLLTNYSWMLAEGFYLHTLLVSAFISEEKLVKWLTGLGWTLPALFILVYTSLRIIFGHTEQ